MSIADNLDAAAESIERKLYGTEPAEHDDSTGEKPRSDLTERETAGRARDQAAADLETSPTGDTDDVAPSWTLSDLAEQLGRDVSELYSTRIPYTAPNGERAWMTLEAAKDSHQASERVEAKRREVESSREFLTQRISEADQVAATLQARVIESDSLLAQLVEAHQADLANVDWNRLRHENPAEWAARRREAEQRERVIQGFRERAEHAWQEALEAQGQAKQLHRLDALKHGEAVLRKEIPDWYDGTGHKTVTYMKSKLGFTEDDLQRNTDPRLLIMANKARIHDEASEGLKAKKKQKGWGKLLKPGALQQRLNAQQRTEMDARKRLRKSGKEHDAAAAIAARMNRNPRNDVL